MVTKRLQSQIDAIYATALSNICSPWLALGDISALCRLHG